MAAPANSSTPLVDGADNSSSTTAAETFAVYVGTFESPEAIKSHWKWILAIGIFNFITGILCLLFPVLATSSIEIALASLVFVSGLVNVVSVSYDGSRHPLLPLGLVQILLAIFMFLNPVFMLALLTLVAAIIFMSAGVFQISVAKQNSAVAGRGMMMLSGILAILMSLLIVIFMPTAQWITLGVLFGVNLVNLGAARILLALYGRSLASEDRSSSDSWRNVMESGFT